MAADLYDAMAEIASKKGGRFGSEENKIIVNTLELKRSVEERSVGRYYLFLKCLDNSDLLILV